MSEEVMSNELANPAHAETRYFLDPDQKIHNLYPTPLYQSMVKNYDGVQDELKKTIKDNITFDMNECWSSHYLSDIFFKLNVCEEYHMQVFLAELATHLQDYCKYLNFNGNCKVTESWFSLFKKGNYGHLHHHGSADISGVYYFKTNGEDGNLFFDSPNPHLGTSTVFYGMTPRHEIKPIQGQLLLFPGWLMHGIQTNTTDEDRVSLSFNIDFERTY
ncbi:MAG: hypothetical protein CL557_11115 [Alphaproteobacteria bacterium]|nr:hypothetical protein [Alphaproteobacteria bacterium]|tara:strand:+ start:6866 stop:7516 length:651 start_codon:yes stop_codon:yes gene_type:complete